MTVDSTHSRPLRLAVVSSIHPDFDPRV